MAVVTALTAQNTQRVLGMHLPPPDFVAAEIEAVFDDVEVHAVKIGMLGSGDIARVVADTLRRRNVPSIVLDPVLVATSGDALATHDLVDMLREELIPLATLITPNLPEAARLADCPAPGDIEGMQHIAERLHGLGARAVLVKGGHLPGPEATDVLFDGKSHRLFTEQRDCDFPRKHTEPDAPLPRRLRHIWHGDFRSTMRPARQSGTSRGRYDRARNCGLDTVQHL